MRCGYGLGVRAYINPTPQFESKLENRAWTVCFLKIFIKKISYRRTLFTNKTCRNIGRHGTVSMFDPCFLPTQLMHTHIDIYVFIWIRRTTVYIYKKYSRTKKKTSWLRGAVVCRWRIRRPSIIHVVHFLIWNFFGRVIKKPKQNCTNIINKPLGYTFSTGVYVLRALPVNADWSVADGNPLIIAPIRVRRS